MLTQDDVERLQASIRSKLDEERCAGREDHVSLQATMPPDHLQGSIAAAEQLRVELVSLIKAAKARADAHPHHRQPLETTEAATFTQGAAADSATSTDVVERAHASVEASPSTSEVGTSCEPAIATTPQRSEAGRQRDGSSPAPTAPDSQSSAGWVDLRAEIAMLRARNAALQAQVSTAGAREERAAKAKAAAADQLAQMTDRLQGSISEEVRRELKDLRRASLESQQELATLRLHESELRERCSSLAAALANARLVAAASEARASEAAEREAGVKLRLETAAGKLAEAQAAKHRIEQDRDTEEYVARLRQTQASSAGYERLLARSKAQQEEHDAVRDAVGKLEIATSGARAGGSNLADRIAAVTRGLNA